MEEKYEIENLPILLDYNNSISMINSNIALIEEKVNELLNENRFNSIVTMANFKDMKESSLFLGRVAKQISDFRIAKFKQETQDIKLFEDSLKKFTSMFKSKQDEIKQGLDIFEEETRKQVKAVCIAYFDDYSLEVGLSDEFKNVNLEDMTQTGFMTASGAISKKGKEEVEKRVQVQLNLQNKVQNRLMMLENECLKAGIEPLTKQHIQGFLFADDNTYINNLNTLIESELRRAEQIKAKQEQELRQKIEAENNKPKEEVTPFDEPKATITIKEEQKIEKVETKIIPVDSDGKVMKTLSCSIRVPAEATDEQIINAVIKMIKSDKFPIENIKIEQ